jgi:D-glycero-D-manno-heptose 1,7-bisphosphate phosphatase
VNRAIFLDRDGVINRKAPEGEYIASRRQLVLLPGVLGAVRKLRDAGFVIFIATNQRGIARRQINPEELDNIHHDLLEIFSRAGAPINKIYVCPHENGCECRKPAPGMLLRAAEENSIDLQASWVVGDSATDIQAGKRAGCRTALIHGTVIGPVGIEHADVKAKDLPDAVRLILGTEGMWPGGEVQTRSNAH